MLGMGLSLAGLLLGKNLFSVFVRRLLFFYLLFLSVSLAVRISLNYTHSVNDQVECIYKTEGLHPVHT